MRLWESLLWLRATEAEDVCHLRLRVTPVSSICVLSCCYGKVIEEEERVRILQIIMSVTQQLVPVILRILSEFRRDTGCKSGRGEGLRRCFGETFNDRRI